MKLNFSKVCLFWGGMDIFYVIRFIWLNIEQGRVPLVDDIMIFGYINSEYGGGFWVLFMFVMSLVLSFSILISAILLIVGWSKVRYFIFAQIPFRLLLVIPSISFMPWVLKQLHVSSVFIFIIFLFLSEIVKFFSFILTKNTQNEGGAYGK